MANLSVSILAKGKLEEAFAFNEQILEKLREVFGAKSKYLEFEQGLFQNSLNEAMK